MAHSLSKLGTFEQCAAKYKFRYLDKLPQGQKSAAASRGIDLHETIDAFIQRRVDGPLQSPLDFYQGFLERIRAVDGILSEFQYGVDRSWVGVDGPWNSEDMWLRAVFDTLVPPIDGQAEVFDWKSGKIYENHRDQRELYACLALAKYPEATRVRATSVYLDIGQQRGEIYFPNDIFDARSRWANRLGRLDAATEFPFNPQYSCRWCPYSKAQGGPCLF
jgi:RecB family exonuclease